MPKQKLNKKELKENKIKSLEKSIDKKCLEKLNNLGMSIKRT